MTGVVPDILARIVDHKRGELETRRALRDRFERAAAARTDFRDFRAALLAAPPAIIAECKKASPSKGLLMPDYHPATLAADYQSGGAAALSVLTDERFFQGSLGDLGAARSAVSIPVLRKDFTLDEFHVVEAAAHGADAILLIAALLPASRLRTLRELAASHRLAALVEVHDEAELASAIESGADIIGVNNRNLHTFQVSLETAARLASAIPDGVVRVAESGIHSREDVRLLAGCGYNAFLVGEHLVRSGNAAGALRALRA